MDIVCRFLEFGGQVQLDFWIMYLFISNPGLMPADHVKFINVNWLLCSLNYLNPALPPL